MALEWAVSVTIKITSPSDSVAQALEEAEASFFDAVVTRIGSQTR